MRSIRLRLAGATVVFAVLVAAGGATAHPGATTASSLKGTVVVALRPSAGAVAAVRAVDAQTGTTAAHGRVGAAGGQSVEYAFSVTIPYPWSPLAQVVTANAPFYTDATAARLRGSYTVPGTPISYTWDLTKGR